MRGAGGAEGGRGGCRVADGCFYSLSRVLCLTPHFFCWYFFFFPALTPFKERRGRAATCPPASAEKNDAAGFRCGPLFRVGMRR